MRLEIVKGLCPDDPPPAGTRRERAKTVADWLHDGTIWRLLFRFDSVTVWTPRLDADSRPFLTALVARLLSRGLATIQDQQGAQIRITWLTVLARMGHWIGSAIRGPLVRGRVARMARNTSGLPRHHALGGGAALYLRPDLWYGVQAGGSVGHIAGVFRHLDQGRPAPTMFTTDANPLIDSNAAVRLFSPPLGHWDHLEMPELQSNLTFPKQVLQSVNNVGFVYHRLAIHSLCALEVANALRVPIVVEYNGSEVWVRDNWGPGVRHRRLAQKIEELNLQAANLVVAVSDPLRRGLVARGVAPERIVMVPNGVDTEVFRPDLSSIPVRGRLGIPADALVVGFIGTFGPWHGAEDLARASLLLEGEARSVHFLWIGDGDRLAKVQKIVRGERHHFTGLVAQKEAPEHLAACDVLVSPQVHNPDGSEFFGSPTKLFEYLAMGRAVVATAVGQNTDVIEEGRSGLLAPPNDSAALAGVLQRVLDDDLLRARLGAGAREQALERHSWSSHVGAIMDALEQVTE